MDIYRTVVLLNSQTYHLPALYESSPKLFGTMPEPPDICYSKALSHTVPFFNRVVYHTSKGCWWTVDGLPSLLHISSISTFCQHVITLSKSHKTQSKNAKSLQPNHQMTRQNKKVRPDCCSNLSVLNTR